MLCLVGSACPEMCMHVSRCACKFAVLQADQEVLAVHACMHMQQA